MRLSINQYAKSLYAATKDKSQEEVDLVVSNFLKLLQKNGQTKLIKKIVEKFSKFWNSENGIVEAEVASREKLSSELRNKLHDYITSKYQAKEVILNNVIDKNIQGGVIIKVGDDLMDASVAGALINLKKELIK